MSRGGFLDSPPRRLDNRPVRALAVVACLVAVAACKRGGAGQHACPQVGARFYALAHAQIDADATLTAPERRGVLGLLAPMRDSMVRACTEDRWAEPARACFVAAADRAAFHACEARLSAEQRALLARHASGKR